MNGGDLVKEFCRRRSEHFPKYPYIALFARDAKILKGLVEILGEEETFARAEAFFVDNSHWNVAASWSIPRFKAEINKYDKTIASVARATAEATRKRSLLNENPGRDRVGNSEPKELKDILSQIAKNR